MHKFVLKLFNILRDFVQFIKILLVFEVMLLCLYWTQNLLQENWSFLNFAKYSLNMLVYWGSLVSKDSIVIFDVAFEYKYFIAVLLILGLYFVAHLLFIGLNFLENLYNEGRIFVKKVEENSFNDKLNKKHVAEQEKIKRYQIYVATSIKQKRSVKSENVNLDEINLAMNKFLIGKTGVSPIKYTDGFLYTFENFSKIDSVLEIFFKLFKSHAPVDYVVCVQILNKDIRKENDQLNSLIRLRFLNKISMLSDTAYRYRFNSDCKYEVSQLGIFQKDNKTIEAHEFI